MASRMDGAATHTYTRARIHAHSHAYLDDDLSLPTKGDVTTTMVGRWKSTADSSLLDVTGLAGAALTAAVVSAATVMCPTLLW